MKKLMCILVLTLGWLISSEAQEIVYGTVRTDGYQKITKGAMWSQRPEAKEVYEGRTPPGCIVYDLKEEYWVRFVDEEHNNFDRNYIVFPIGAKVYFKDNCYYSAICGNKIEYIRPVNMVKIVEKVVEKPVEKPSEQPKPVAKVEVRDTVIYRTTIVEETVYQQNYQPRMGVCMGFGGYQRPMIMNRNYYGGNNYYSRPVYHRPSYQRPNYQPHRSMGGPRYYAPPVTQPHRSMGGPRYDNSYQQGNQGGGGGVRYN